MQTDGAQDIYIEGVEYELDQPLTPEKRSQVRQYLQILANGESIFVGG